MKEKNPGAIKSNCSENGPFYQPITNGGIIFFVNEGQTNISKFSEKLPAAKIAKGKSDSN